MSSPQRFFTDDHRACDTQWAQVEQAVEAGDDAAAQAAWTTFDTAMRRHFDMEEHVLFPRIETAYGAGFGPVRVMRGEHQQMRGLLDQMGHLAQTGDLEGLVDQGDTLLMLIQQHNVKEETMLYPIADRVIQDWFGVKGQLERY